MMYQSAPMRPHRLAALFMSFAFAVIGGSVGLNALIKSNQDRGRIQRVAEALGITVTIDDKDVFRSGIVVTTVCALIALLTLIYLILTLLPHPSSSYTSSTRATTTTSPTTSRFTRRGIPISTSTLPFQSSTLAFCAVWLFAVQVAFTDFVANRQASITATFANGQQVPASIVSATESQLGVSPVYHTLSYLRLLAILPWFTFLFTTIATIILFIAARRRIVLASPTVVDNEKSGM